MTSFLRKKKFMATIVLQTQKILITNSISTASTDWITTMVIRKAMTTAMMMAKTMQVSTPDTTATEDTTTIGIPGITAGMIHTGILQVGATAMACGILGRTVDHFDAQAGTLDGTTGTVGM